MEWSRLYLTLDFKYVLDLFMCNFAPESHKNTGKHWSMIKCHWFCRWSQANLNASNLPYVLYELMVTHTHKACIKTHRFCDL